MRKPCVQPANVDNTTLLQVKSPPAGTCVRAVEMVGGEGRSMEADGHLARAVVGTTDGVRRGPKNDIHMRSQSGI